MEKIIKVTRLTHMGWGYNATPNPETGLVDLAKGPQITGKISQVLAAISRDHQFRDMEDKSTLIESWFVWHGNGWWRVVHLDNIRLVHCLTVRDGRDHFMFSAVEVSVQDTVSRRWATEGL